jgi:hypothetical protein
MAGTMKNADFSGVAPCGSCKNRCFEGTYRLKFFVASFSFVRYCFVPRPLILSTLMVEVLLSSGTSVLTQPHGVTTPKTAFSMQPCSRQFYGRTFHGGRSYLQSACRLTATTNEALATGA